MFSPEKIQIQNVEKKESKPKLRVLESTQANVFEKQNQIFKAIEDNKDNLSREDLLTISSDIFNNSLEDGLKIAERLQLTPEEIKKIISKPDFFLKQGSFCNTIKNKLEKKLGKEKNSASDLIDRYKGYEQTVKENQAGKLLSPSSKKVQDIKAKNILKELDSLYASFLSHRNVKEKNSDNSKSNGERLAENNLIKQKLIFEKSYYSGGVFTAVSNALDDSQKEKVSQLADKEGIATKEALIILLKKKGIDAEKLSELSQPLVAKKTVDEIASEIEPNKKDKFERDLKRNIYQPVVSTNKLAEENLIKEISESVGLRVDDEINISLNKDTNKYEIDGIDKSREEDKQFIDAAKKAINASMDKNSHGEVVEAATKLVPHNPQAAKKAMNDLMNKGAYVEAGNIAQGLAPYDVQASKKVMNELLEKGKYYGAGDIARELASHDPEASKKAMNDLMEKGKYVEAGWVAQKLAPHDSEASKKAMNDLMEKGKYVEAGWVAQELVSHDSEASKKVMNELLEKEEYGEAGNIARALASHDSKAAEEVMNNLMSKGKYSKAGDIAQELVSHDSKAAEEVMNKFMSKGEYERAGYIARELVPHDRQAAKKIMNDLMEKGEYWSVYDIASGFIPHDPQVAKEIAEELIKKGDHKNAEILLRDLAPHDYQSAKKLFDRLIEAKRYGEIMFHVKDIAPHHPQAAKEVMDSLVKEGQSSMAGFVALEIAYYDPQAAKEKMKALIDEEDFGVATMIAKKLVHYDPQAAKEAMNDLIIKGEHANAGKIALEFLNLENKETLNASENNKLTLLNLVHNPQEQEIDDFFQNQEKPDGSPSLGASGVGVINKMIKQSPEFFLKTMSGKKDRLQDLVSSKLISKIFPEYKEKEQNSWRNFGGYSGFSSGGENKQGESNPLDHLNSNESIAMIGGDPKEANPQEIMELRDNINELIVTGIYGKYENNEWHKTYFPISIDLTEPTEEKTIILPSVKSGQKIVLPKTFNSKVIKERIKGINGQDEENKINSEIDSLNSTTVNVDNNTNKIIYSIEQCKIPEILPEVSNKEYDSFKDKFNKNFSFDLTREVMPLSSELEIFIDSIKDKKTKEKIIAIEKFVRDMSYYDFDNGEVISLKKNKSPEELLYIMEMRIEELRQKDDQLKEALSNKKFAGVCYDFNLLTTSLLRKAGVVSGIASGFAATGKKVMSTNAHSTAFVVLPDAKGSNKVFTVDGTPSGLDGNPLPGLTLDSIEEKESKFQDQLDDFKKESDEKLEEMMEILEKQDPDEIKKLTNGELERILNNVLRYEVKTPHLKTLNRVLDAYWYSPVEKLNFENNKAELENFLGAEIERQRKINKDEEISKPAGTYLFETIESFVEKLIKGKKTDDLDRSLELTETIFDSVKSSLNNTEKRAVNSIITYLKAKKMAGDSVSKGE